MFQGTNLGLVTAAVLVVGGIQGCSSGPPTPAPTAMPPHTATVSINGSDTSNRYIVTCNQIQWLLSIDAVNETTGFTAMIAKGGAPDAKFVKIRNLGGFTGSAWDGGVGQIEARRDGGLITVAGSGYGFFADNPNEPATTPFTIKAAC